MQESPKDNAPQELTTQILPVQFDTMETSPLLTNQIQLQESTTDITQSNLSNPRVVGETVRVIENDDKISASPEHNQSSQQSKNYIIKPSNSDWTSQSTPLCKNEHTSVKEAGSSINKGIKLA